MLSSSPEQITLEFDLSIVNRELLKILTIEISNSLFIHRV